MLYWDWKSGFMHARQAFFQWTTDSVLDFFFNYWIKKYIFLDCWIGGVRTYWLTHVIILWMANVNRLVEHEPYKSMWPATAKAWETGQLGSPVLRGSWPLTHPVPPAHYALWPFFFQLTDFKERASKESTLWLFPYAILRDPHASPSEGKHPTRNTPELYS